jgi:hypothetical protein
VAQQPGREERLAGASLPPAERGRRRQAEPGAPEDLDRCPGELMAAPLADREQAGRRRRQQAGARQLEAVGPGRPGQPQAQRHHRERGHADRHVDEEDPAPARGLGDQAAEERAADQAEPEQDRRDGIAAGGAALAAVGPVGREVADDDHGDAHQAAAAEPLQGAEDDELGHALRHPAQHRSGHEDGHGGQVDGLDPDRVGELAVQRLDGGAGQRVPGQQPGQVGDAAGRGEGPRDVDGAGRHDGQVEDADQQRGEGGDHDAEGACLRHLRVLSYVGHKIRTVIILCQS